MGVEWFRAVDDIIRAAKLRVKLFEDGVREAGANVADGLEGLRGGVVASQQEGAVDGGTFALTVVGAEDDEVEGVAYAGEVVFLDLGKFVIKQKKVKKNFAVRTRRADKTNFFGINVLIP